MKEHNYQFYAYLGAALTLAVILVFGVFAALQPVHMHESATELRAEAIGRGVEVFARDCATCHGGRGEGVRNIGPALNTQEFLREASDELVFNTITDGRPGTSMPAWGQARGGPYNAQLVEDLVALIRSWQATAPSAQELVHRGDPVEGAVLFSTTCYACHGVSGEGADGPRLNDRASLAKFDDDYYRQAIADGRPERGMPTWGTVLSPAQIGDLVAYIRGWEKEVPMAMANLGGDATRGESIFASTCVACHGPAGQGTDVAPPLIEAPILEEPEAVYTTISQGRLEVGMPSWGQVLSPAEINDVIAYLGRLGVSGTAEATAPAQEEAEDDLAAIQFTYIKTCATCHGISGEGKDERPALINNEFIQGNDDESLFNLIANGRANTAMEGFAGELSQEDIRQIMKLLRSWQ
jgi:cytochrome c oxidase cbb3-type subunit 3